MPACGVYVPVWYVCLSGVCVCMFDECFFVWFFCVIFVYVCGVCVCVCVCGVCVCVCVCICASCKL